MIKRATPIMALALAALTFAAVPGIATAQDGASADQQQAQKLMQEYRQKATKLQEIHEETIQSNPELKQQQKEFEKGVRSAVDDQGYDVEKGQERVKEMAQKLQSGDLSDSERKALMKDFQAERRQMTQARDAALQKPEIKSAGEKLQQDTLAAMKKQDGQTDKLLKEMDKLRGELRSQMPAGAQQGNAG
jgi:cysteinyl-tRNA synthetase